MTGLGTLGNPQPTALEAVNRVLRECNLEQVGSLAVATSNRNIVPLVLDALNDGMWEIWARHRWPWAAGVYSFALVEGQDAYPLPSDFKETRDSARWNGMVLHHLTLDEWTQSVPDSTQGGSPIVIRVDGPVVRIWPSPNAGVVSLGRLVTLPYWRKPTGRLSTSQGSDAFDVPNDLLECLVSFAKWKAKQFMEYPDWQNDQARYEQTLALQIRRAYPDSQAPHRLRLR